MEQEINLMQKLIIRYCRQRGYSDINAAGLFCVKAVDPSGSERILTANVYGDIMDAETGKMIAEGKTSHDIRKTYEFPHEWKDLAPDEREKLSELEEDTMRIKRERENMRKFIENSRQGPVR